MTPFIAEIIGTALMIFLGNGVVANALLKNTKGNGSGLIEIATAWAFAVFVGVTVAGPVSGAHLNPAVTIGLAVANRFAWNEVPSYILAEFIGAFIGAFLVWFFYKDHFKITEDKGTKLACFSTGPAIRNYFSNFCSEFLGTFVLLFVIYYISGPDFQAPNLENAKIGLGSIGALPVAILVWVIGLALGGTTGYAINPARDLSPRIVHAIFVRENSDWKYAWIPVIAPICGAIAAGLFFLIF